jgi:YD repeat-containing protein
MPTILITEITGTGQVVGPEVTQQFLVSGNDYGDTVTVNATQSQMSVGVAVTESPQTLNVTGISSGDNISVSIIEAVYPTGSGALPQSTRFYYSGDGKLIQKTVGAANTDYTYNAQDQLYQVITSSYTKTMLYNTDGDLTGFNVT